MTIKKLKELLQEYPDTAEVEFVCVESTERCGNDLVSVDIEDISGNNKHVQILVG